MKNFSISKTELEEVQNQFISLCENLEEELKKSPDLVKEDNSNLN
ncbi:MAG: hypothetical protein QG583_610 [Patescibacteria group bacterium]|nr:hypothetical protein [Patescibacteria group bacterium]